MEFLKIQMLADAYFTYSIMRRRINFMALKIKFKNKKTGEIIEIDYNDEEKFDEYMSNKDYILVF